MVNGPRVARKLRRAYERGQDVGRRRRRRAIQRDHRRRAARRAHRRGCLWSLLG